MQCRYFFRCKTLVAFRKGSNKSTSLSISPWSLGENVQFLIVVAAVLLIDVLCATAIMAGVSNINRATSHECYSNV